MSELAKYLVEQMLLEDENPIKKTVVIFVGRFQPMHKGHYGTYQHLVKKFGKDNVHVGTSDKVQKPKSPFNFKEKVKIMTTMFGIPKSKIHKVKNPYKPTEILKKFDEDTTAFITVVGEKDKSRLKGPYFRPYKGDVSVGYRDGGYVYVAPSSGGGISGTETRNGLSVGSDDQKQDFFKDRAYGKFNKTIFKLITDKLNEGIFISKERIEEWMINESSAIATGQSDDGPNIFFPNYEVFARINAKRAAKIGYEIINMITTKELEDYYEHPTYPNGPVKAVTPFPAGVLGAQTATNQIDIYSSDAYSKWFKHVTRKASLVGYSVVGGLDTNKDEKEQSLDSQQGDKKSQEEYESSLTEAIKLPVEIGDTLLMGKFKNKKVVVKKIGEDEHGMPTINGKKVVTFRYHKKAPNVFEQIVELAGTEIKCEKCNHQWKLEADDSIKYLCTSCGWDSHKKEYNFDAFDSWQEKIGLNESEDLDERGKMRPADRLRRKASMAGKGKEIARKRARTMKRRKPLSKLKKIAYKMAYRQVYAEFSEELYPGIKKSDLSIAQTQVVHRNVVRKKGRIIKRAKFRFLPALRQKEVEKFQGKNEDILDQAFLKAKPVKEGRPIPMDTPNEFVYLDFRKYAYKKRGMFKKELLKNKDNSGRMFLTLSALWYKWARKDNKEFTHIKDKLKFGRALMIMMVQDNIIFNKKAWKKDNKITHIKELDKSYYKNQDSSLPTTVSDKTKPVKFISKSSIQKAFNDYHKTSSYVKMGTGANMDTIEPGKRKAVKESIITEGGAYGHMSHPFDTDINLTFGQLKDIVNRALEGTLEFTREKTDGQALAISWKEGRLVAARNKGHLKNKGENALDIKGVSDKFQGRGELEKAYNFAMKDLSDSIKSLSDKQRDKIFKQGACFMNLEVIYPTSVNVIPYGQALLVFHGTMEFDIDGVAIGENGDAARVLAGMIKQVNKDVQDNYTIQGPPVVKLPKSQNLSKKRSQYSSQISKLQKEFSLKDTDGVADYHQAWWSQWVDKNSPSTLDNKTKMGLVKRWAFYDKGFRLDKRNITDEKTLEWSKKIDKQDQVKISKTNVMKFEQIFLGLGAEVLEFTSSALTVNPTAAVRDMKKRIDKTIKDVKKSGDPKKIGKLKLELQRLNSIGGSKKIVPNEGIVFLYNGNTFKLTGTFASVNQILGIFF